MEINGFRDQISTKTHAAISLNFLRLKALFSRFILRVIRGYIVHDVFEPQIGENLLDNLHTENTQVDRVVSHTSLIFYFDFLFFYAKNEAADLFFVMKPKTDRISHLNAAI